MNYNLAHVSYRLGRREKCSEAAEAVLRLAPAHPGADLLMALSLVSKAGPARPTVIIRKPSQSNPLWPARPIITIGSDATLCSRDCMPKP